jgi:hypothetical protein
MAKVWSDFYSLLAPHVPGCPDVSMDTHLSAAAADFLARSQVWRDVADKVFLVPNVSTYDISADFPIERITAAAIGGSDITQVDSREIPEKNRSEVGEPTKFWVVQDTMISVWPIPDKRYTMSFRAALKPSRTALSVPDWVYEVWADALVSGAIARLAAIPNKEWSDINAASMHKLMFERAITSARVRDLRGVESTVKMRPFY